MDKKKQRHYKMNKSVILILLPVAYIFIGNMKAVYSTPLPFREWVLVIYTLLGLICMLFFYTTHRISRNNPLFIIFLFALFSIVPTFMAYIEYSLYSAIHIVGQSLFWVAAFSLAYIVGFYNTDTIQSVKVVIILIPIFATLFLNVKAFSAGRGIPLLTTAYYNLFLFPFLLTVENKVLRLSLLAIIFATVLLSVKRTGFLALSLALVVYFLVNYKVTTQKNRRKLYTFIGGIITIMFLYVFLNYFTQKYDIGILNKFYTMFDDEGSGRYDIWRRTWEMIKNSNFVSLIFGHGFNTVYLNSMPQFSAHTDFLEIIYDYGIIGSYLYLRFYLCLIKYYKYLYRIKSKIAAPFASTLCITLVFSAFSHLIIYPTYFIFFCIFWGLVLGDCDREISKQREVRNI